MEFAEDADMKPPRGIMPLGGAFQELTFHKSKIKRISRLTIGLLYKLGEGLK